MIRLLTCSLLMLLMRPLTQAQTSELYQYDAKVDQFLASGQVDSLLHYNRLKLALCKSSGNQTLWAWVCMETADFLEEQVGEPAAGEFLETMWPQRWHEPQNAKDCEPFAYMLAGRRYENGFAHHRDCE